MQGGNGFSTSLHVDTKNVSPSRALRSFTFDDGTCYVKRFAAVEARPYFSGIVYSIKKIKRDPTIVIKKMYSFSEDILYNATFF